MCFASRSPTSHWLVGFVRMFVHPRRGTAVRATSAVIAMGHNGVHQGFEGGATHYSTLGVDLLMQLVQLGRLLNT